MKAKIAVLFVLLVYFTSSIIYPFAESSSTFVIFNGTEENVSISGYTTEITPGQYSFKNKITYQILSPQKTEFNRYTIRYSSSACVKGTIYYKIGTVTHDETFYLEPGYNANFSSLIDSYLNGQAGANVFKIDFVGIEASLTTFTLYEIRTEIYENQLSETIYLENGRFKLGVCLMWGGGLNYFEDKKDNDSTITNMLNYHDTGRLIQQSYYGTMSAPYICSTYGDTTWAYNPVQGGDQHGNKSKLVDFTIEEDSIYVKCLPLDWAKNGTYTMSYMENRYTLNEDYVSVDNRFIDFSGYDHGYEKDQELPAFYTISYLDTFTFYNGNKPWTDGKLITKEALPFWGGNGDCYFTMSSKNTETWCAWTNEENGYGIGLYTPGITTLLAGRFEYDDSKDPMSNSTNYVAPLIRTTMRNFEAFEYSYIITSGTVSEMRSTFKEHKDDEA
ncbi:MAG: hypothetical protein IJZ90_00465, partial [Clostridia bacterium]|nr:hypothetical protein [Clostridia bacterium]